MGLFESVTEILEAPSKITSGVVNGVIDTGHLIGDVRRHDYIAAGRDLVKVMADGADIVESLGALGGSVASVPKPFKAAQMTDPASKIIWAAIKTIEGMEKATGTGTPYDGTDFRKSSKKLNSVIMTLDRAQPQADQWNGTASQVYAATNASHRRVVSAVMDADDKIAGILDTEAGQVTRTRQSLSDDVEWLELYDRTTMWANYGPAPARALKIALDTAVATATLATAGTTLTILVKNSLENANRIRGHLGGYEAALKDKSGMPLGAKPFPVPDAGHMPPRLTDKDQPGPKMPAEGTPVTDPTRKDPNGKYTPPSPEEPIPTGPPATPYGMPAGPSAQPAPASPAPAPSSPPAQPAAPATGPAPATPLAPAAFAPRQPAVAAPAASGAPRPPQPTVTTPVAATPHGPQSATSPQIKAPSDIRAANPGPRAPVHATEDGAEAPRPTADTTQTTNGSPHGN